jgi:hypothetical protein
MGRENYSLSESLNSRREQKMKQQNPKDTAFEYILQSQQNNLKRYLSLAPRLGPKDLDIKKQHPHHNSPSKRLNSNFQNTAK